MTHKDVNSFGGLIGDLWRETSFAVFFCTVGGMVLGVVVATVAVLFWFAAMASLAHGATVPARVPSVVAYLLVVPGGFVGGVLGCLFGVVIDFLVNLIHGPKPKRVAKKWDPEREAARRECRRRPGPEDRGDIGEHWNPGTNFQRRPED